MAAGKLSLIVFSGDYARAHYALAAAAAAAAVDRPATLFFTMQGARALLAAGADGEEGWRSLAGADADAGLRERGVAGFEELLDSCAALGVRFMVCEMGLRALGRRPRSTARRPPDSGGGAGEFFRGRGGRRRDAVRLSARPYGAAASAPSSARPSGSAIAASRAARSRGAASRGARSASSHGVTRASTMRR